MAGAARERHKNGAPIPLGMDPTGVFEAFMQRMEYLGSQNNWPTPPPIVLPPLPPRQMGDKLLERFYALRLDKFDGMAKSWRVKQWLWELEVILDAIECNK